MFKKARLKLTAWYLLIIVIVSMSFSVVIYGLVSDEIKHFARIQQERIQRNIPPPPIEIINRNDDLIEESKLRLLWNLVTINGIVLVVSGSLAYLLAGKTLAPIRVMNEEQKRFISDASHELRTPLTGLKAMFEVTLRDKNLGLEDSKKSIKRALTEIDSMKKLTDYLLKLDRNSEEKISEKKSIQKIIKETIKNVALEAKRKKITIKSKSENGFVETDHQKLTESLVIILDNAVKYSPKNSQILFNGYKRGTKVYFEVSDKGIGIKKEDLEKIFTRFYRADNARSKNKIAGFGLGLSIAQKNIKELGGEIRVESKINEGSKFQVIFS